MSEKDLVPCHRPGSPWSGGTTTEVVARPDRDTVRQHAALPGRHGSLRRRAPPASQAQGSWSRRPTDQRQFNCRNSGVMIILVKMVLHLEISGGLSILAGEARPRRREFRRKKIAAGVPVRETIAVKGCSR
jgi:hypothetical protein